MFVLLWKFFQTLRQLLNYFYGQIYSNGMSEVILGNAIKKLNLPRDEIVVMTKVYHVVGRTWALELAKPDSEFEKLRYTNQFGLGRKVRV